MAQLFPSDRLFLIAGPCVVEDDALNMRVATEIARLESRVPGGVIFKASFDKANRSNAGAARGPGFNEGLAALDRVRSATGLRILTDVHLPDQCAGAAEFVDALQIPAFLSRQTDLLQAAGATGKSVNIKKGQWLHPEAMRGAVEKVRESQPSGRAAEIAVTERGTFFGYGDLVVDMRSFCRMRDACNAPVIFDGGAREFIPHLAMAAIAAGAQGIFIETHPDPDNAPSDGPNMLPLSELESLIDRLVGVWEKISQ